MSSEPDNSDLGLDKFEIDATPKKCRRGRPKGPSGIDLLKDMIQSLTLEVCISNERLTVLESKDVYHVPLSSHEFVSPVNLFNYNDSVVSTHFKLPKQIFRLCD